MYDSIYTWVCEEQVDSVDWRTCWSHKSTSWVAQKKQFSMIITFNGRLIGVDWTWVKSFGIFLQKTWDTPEKAVGPRTQQFDPRPDAAVFPSKLVRFLTDWYALRAVTLIDVWHSQPLDSVDSKRKGALGPCQAVIDPGQSRFPVETVNTMRRIVEEAEHALVSEKVPA